MLTCKLTYSIDSFGMPKLSYRHNISTNDVAGNFSLTLVDVLDTLVVLGDVQGFDQAVRNVIDVSA